MEILTDELRVIKPYSQGKSLGESLMLFVDHMGRSQEGNIILWWEEVHTSSIVGQRHGYEHIPITYAIIYAATRP